MKNIRSYYFRVSYKILFAVNSIFKNIFERINKFKIKIERKKYLYDLNIESENDIYISTYSRSGTTWMQMIMYQLTSNGEMNFKHIYDLIPWIDMNISPYKKMELNTNPRIFKTHFDYNYFPKKLRGRVICVLRNGMDVAASNYHFIHDTVPDMTFDEIFTKHFVTSWFVYMKRWIENKNNYSILYIKYEDLKKDLRKEVYKIAEFCNLKVNEADLPRIIERSSFEYMKKYEDKFADVAPVIKSKNFIRSGKSDTGKDYLNAEQLELYRRNYNYYLAKFEILKDYK